MELEHRLFERMTKFIMLPPPIVKITLGRVNCSEVGGRDEKFCCEYVECELV